MILEYIIISMFLDVAIMPHGNLYLYSADTDYIEFYDMWSVNVDMGFDVSVHGIHIGGAMKVNAVKSGSIYFSPQSLGSWFWFYYEYELLQVGIRHYCIHPVLPYFTLYKEFQMNYEGAFTEIYLRVELTNRKE